MIERDPIALSACGVHVRRFDGAGGKDCPLCRAMVHAARTEALSERVSYNTGKPIGGQRVHGSRQRGGSKGPRLVRMPPSDRSIALRARDGQAMQ